MEARSLVIFILFVVLAAAPQAVRAVEKAESFSWRSGSGVTALDVQNHVGDVVITAGAGDAVVVKAVKHVEAATAHAAAEYLESVTISAKVEGGVARVKGEYPHVYIGPAVVVDFEITVPATTPAGAKTSNGDITITGVATAAGESRAGNVTIVDAPTSAAASADRGAVVIKGGGKAAAAAVSDGTIDIWGAYETVSAETRAGAINLEAGEGVVNQITLGTEREGDITASFAPAAGGGGKYVFVAGAGNINLRLAGGWERCSASVATAEGKITVGDQVRGVRLFNYDAGANANYVAATTRTGDITITAADAGAAAPVIGE